MVVALHLLLVLLHFRLILLMFILLTTMHPRHFGYIALSEQYTAPQLIADIK